MYYVDKYPYVLHTGAKLYFLGKIYFDQHIYSCGDVLIQIELMDKKLIVA